MATVVVGVIGAEEVIRVRIITIRWRIAIAFSIIVGLWEIDIDITTVSWIVGSWGSDQNWSWVVIIINKAIVEATVAAVVVSRIFIRESLAV